MINCLYSSLIEAILSNCGCSPLIWKAKNFRPCRGHQIQCVQVFNYNNNNNRNNNERFILKTEIHGKLWGQAKWSGQSQESSHKKKCNMFAGNILTISYLGVRIRVISCGIGGGRAQWAKIKKHSTSIK